MWKDKRGVESGYFEILDLILIMLIAGSFSVFLINLNSDTYFERDFIAKDISLFEHALYASPGEVEKYEYYSPQEIVYVLETKRTRMARDVIDVEVPTKKERRGLDLSLFNIIFTTNKVEVAEKNQQNGVTYYAYNRPNFQDQNINGKETFTFKESERLEIIADE